MEYTLLILLLLIMIWINLRNKISKSQEKTEELLKEIAALRKRLENSPEVADEIKEPEPETLKEPEVFVQPEPVRAIVEPAKNPQPQKVRKPVNYEKYIGENLFGKIGILILVLGMGLFVKYAIDKEWINETLRTILGFGMGGLLLFVAWHLKDSYRTFSSLLAGGAFAIFYVTVVQNIKFRSRACPRHRKARGGSYRPSSSSPILSGIVSAPRLMKYPPAPASISPHISSIVSETMTSEIFMAHF